MESMRRDYPDMNQIQAIYIYTHDKGRISMTQTKWLTNIGIEGDKHAIGGDRQIQIASAAAIETLSCCDGACFSRFKANVVLDSLPAESLRIGMRLQVGGAEIEITGFKRCPFQDCPMHAKKNSCILLKETVVAKVIRGGLVNIGSFVCLNSNNETKVNGEKQHKNDF